MTKPIPAVEAVKSILHASTAHLSEEVVSVLQGKIRTAPVRFVQTDDGYLIWVPDENGTDIPMLVRAYAVARNRRCVAIWFSAKGPRLDELPVVHPDFIEDEYRRLYDGLRLIAQQLRGTTDVDADQVADQIMEATKRLEDISETA